MFSKFHPFEGPAEIKFKDPDTGREFKENDKQTLVNRIRVYRAQNNLEPIEELESVLECYWCGLPENAGKCGPVTLKRGFMAYLKGGMALIKNMAYPSTVSQEEADRRASICVKCPKNVFPDKGAFLKWSDEIAYHSIGDRRSKLHDELGNCEICSCPMRAKVWHDGKIDLEPEWIEPMKSVGCWQLNFRKE